MLARDELVIGEIDAVDEGGGETVQIEQAACDIGDRNSRMLEPWRKVVDAAVDIQAEAENEVAHLVRVNARLGEHPTGFPSGDVEVIRPFEARRDFAEIGDELAHIQPHPECEILEFYRSELGAKNKGNIEIAVGGAVPRALAASVATSLFSGDDDERCRLAGGEEALSLSVCTVDLVEANDPERAGLMYETGLDQHGVRFGRGAGQPGLCADSTDNLSLSRF